MPATTTSDPIEALLDALHAHQRERGWADSRMARYLNVPRSTWTVYRLRKQRPGRKFLRKVAAIDGWRRQATAAFLAAPS